MLTIYPGRGLAVNFCKKRVEMRQNIYFFHRIHCKHRISYKNLPRSSHFLQKFTQKTSTRVYTLYEHVFCSSLSKNKKTEKE